VIGEVLEFGGLQNVLCARKEVTKVEFTLRDINVSINNLSNHRIHCCIFGNLAEILTESVKQPNNGDICLIRYAKIGNYKGELQVSNAFDTSFVLINPDIKEAQSLKQMFHGDANAVDLYQHKNDKILIQKQRKKWSQYPFKTIQEMKRSDKGGNCRVICTVYAIDTSSGWYYLDCMVCKNKVFKPTVSFDEIFVPTWWCDICQCIVTKVSPRYKLDLLVQDQTGESKFTLLDSEAKLIVKTTAAKIVKLSLAKIEDQDVLPPEIVEIVGKTYGFGFSDDDNNMIGGADVSTAMKVWNLNDIMWKRIKSLHQMSTYSRKKQCTNDEGDKNKTKKTNPSHKMSSKQKIVYLDEIRPWKTAWLIEAKILHTWKPSNASFGESLEIVMSDKKGTKIHATCKKNYLQSLGEQCKVGEWKTLYNFQVSATGKHYRPTQHMYKITFINQTVIKPSEFQNDDMFLSLATFDSIMSGKLDNDILIGNLQISNGYDSSQLVFNPNIKEAEEIREAYKFHDDSLSIVETSEEGKDIVSQANNGTRQKLTGWETVEVKTISEILNFTQNVMNVKPRYKLHLVAKDDTAKAKFVLLDWVAWPVIGVKAEKILNGSLDEVEDPEMLPDCINEIVGKTYNFGVTIEKGSETFKVLKVWSVYNTLMVDSQSESISGKGITANSASEVSLLTYSDESSSKMATPSKRSVDDIVDIPDNTSTSKMRHVKSIKIEKMSSDELALRKN
ncbi:hypothetical protein IGI04_002604, partial [Brassica rapa subsp. trilocularis]